MNRVITQTLLSLSMLAISSNATAAMYCNKMGTLAEFAAKMRDNGLSVKQTLSELRKISPSKKINQDVKDLVESAYIGQNQSPMEFRAFFENFCKSNGFDRELY